MVNIYIDGQFKMTSLNSTAAEMTGSFFRSKGWGCREDLEHDAIYLSTPRGILKNILRFLKSNA